MKYRGKKYYNWRNSTKDLVPKKRKKEKREGLAQLMLLRCQPDFHLLNQTLFSFQQDEFELFAELKLTIFNRGVLIVEDPIIPCSPDTPAHEYDDLRSE